MNYARKSAGFLAIFFLVEVNYSTVKPIWVEDICIIFLCLPVHFI